MFMCKQCLEQYEDQQLAYTLILENRLSHPSASSFILRFCSKAHVQEFLSLISTQHQKYVLSKVTPVGEERLAVDYPLELLLYVGSTKVS